MMRCPNCSFDIENSFVAKFLGSIGGIKSSKKMTKEQRVSRAKKAISDRWKK